MSGFEFRVHNKFPTHYALFFFYEKKAYQEKTYRTEVVLKIKIFNFYLQKQLRS